MTRRSARVVALATSVVALACLASPAALARRVPGLGGKVTVALPPELVGPMTEAHLYAPIVEPANEDDVASNLARPAIPGYASWRSSVIRSLAAEGDGKSWVIGVALPTSPQVLFESLARCFSKHTEGSWPADVLRARGVSVDVAITAPTEVKLRFSEPVGPLPELLAGCSLHTPASGPTGGYQLTGPGALAWSSAGAGALPQMAHIDITSGDARADVVAGGPETPGSALIPAPYPDVVVLLQSASTRKRDPFALFDNGKGGLGMRGFRQALRGDLLAAAYAQGRGAVADGLLPPGVAPARPLPEPQGPDVLAPLSLAQLPASAPRLTIRRVEGDPLIEGVIERLAVILRNRGYLVDIRRATADAPDDGVEILRWRPPTSDPALALLSLAGRRKDLVADDGARRALSDPRLLSSSKDERVAAALSLERAWLDAGVAVPLMTADRWFVVDPDLRGVQIREDGVPLLFDAYFAGGAR
jgi:hypothetical protein